MHSIDKKFRVVALEAYQDSLGNFRTQVIADGVEGEAITFLVYNDNAPPLYSFIEVTMMSE